MNEDAVEQELRRRNYKLRSVYLEFSSADLVVAPTGAGLAHLFAVTDNCFARELIGDTDIRGHLNRIAEILSIPSLHIICGTVACRGLLVDVDNLRLALDTAVSKNHSHG